MEREETLNIAKEFAIGIIISVLLSIVLIFILSLLLSKTDLKENIINPAIIFISALSLLVGGFFVSKKVKNKGIFMGGLLRNNIYDYTIYFF